MSGSCVATSATMHGFGAEVDMGSACHSNNGAGESSVIIAHQQHIDGIRDPRDRWDRRPTIMTIYQRYINRTHDTVLAKTVPRPMQPTSIPNHVRNICASTTTGRSHDPWYM